MLKQVSGGCYVGDADLSSQVVNEIIHPVHLIRYDPVTKEDLKIIEGSHVSLCHTADFEFTSGRLWIPQPWEYTEHSFFKFNYNHSFYTLKNCRLESECEEWVGLNPWKIVIKR